MVFCLMVASTRSFSMICRTCSLKQGPWEPMADVSLAPVNEKNGWNSKYFWKICYMIPICSKYKHAKNLTFNQMNFPKSPHLWNHIYRKCFDGVNFFYLKVKNLTWHGFTQSTMTKWHFGSAHPLYMVGCIVVLKSAIKVTSCFTTEAWFL